MRPGVAAIFAATMFTAIAAKAQDASKQTDAPPAAELPGFPGLGEIMSLQQMRHIKLWFAGNASNWPLADYEIGELREGFDDVTKMLGGDIVDQHVGAALGALDKAIGAKDRAAFTVAFDKLSAGCSACHQTLDHGFIVIQRPTLLPYSDQTFTPKP